MSELVAQAERGEEIYITRRGKRVALLSPVEEGTQDRGMLVFDALRAFRSTAKRGPERLKDLIDEGRR